MTYNVRLVVTEIYSAVVEAENEEEARRLALSQYHDEKLQVGFNYVEAEIE